MIYRCAPEQDAYRASVISRAEGRCLTGPSIARPHLAPGAASSYTSKKDEVNTGSLLWVNGSEGKGQDFYYGLVPDQTQTPSPVSHTICSLSLNKFSIKMVKFVQINLVSV